MARSPKDAGAELAGWQAPAHPAFAVIEGRYLRMEPLSPDHAPALHAANRADDGIWDHMGYGPFAQEADYAAWVASVADRPDPMFFTLIDRARGTPGGVASLMRIDPAQGVAEVGHICLAPAMQRTRAASEMVYLLAARLFAAGYRRFEWKCDARNLRSRRAAERFGFSYEGTFRNHMVVKGRNRDTAWFAMTGADWTCLRPAWEAWLDPANFDAEGRQIQRLGALTAPCRVASDPGA